jgi:pyrimidine deaminase RibD-like protein
MSNVRLLAMFFSLDTDYEMSASVSDFDYACIELAIQEARKARVEGVRAHPMVGAVAAGAGAVLGTAFRGEFALGEHAKYALLERKLKDASLIGATVYTTLEPCTSRHHPRTPYVTRLIDRGVSKVVVGMLDPNPYLSGRGLHVLQQAGVKTELFPSALMTAVGDLNTACLTAGMNSMPPERVHLLGWEWDVLETDGVVAGRTRQGWYEYFLATNDLSNLGRLRGG